MSRGLVGVKSAIHGISLKNREYVAQKSHSRQYARHRYLTNYG